MTSPHNLRRSPIHGHLDLANFHPSPSHEEALARLHYLVEQHLRVGVLLGDSGSGKSLLLAKLADELRSPRRHVVHLSLLGKEPAEALLEIGTQLQATTHSTDAISNLWRAISDRLKEHKYQQHETVVLLDDVHEAHPDTLSTICRLTELDATEEARLTLVVAAESGSLSRLPNRLVERAALRVDVQPWEQQDTLDFLVHAVEQLRNLEGAGVSADEMLPRDVFTADAVSKLHEMSGGLPRRVSQLANWALLAGAGMGLTQVDEETVISAASELGLLSEFTEPQAT